MHGRFPLPPNQLYCNCLLVCSAFSLVPCYYHKTMWGSMCFLVSSCKILAACRVNETLNSAFKMPIRSVNDQKQTKKTFIHPSSINSGISKNHITECLNWILPRQIGVAGLISKVFCVTLLSSIVPVAIATESMSAL